MYTRLLKPLFEESFFLFGARGVGKTWFLKEAFQSKNVLWINLLKPAVSELYEENPSALYEQVDALISKNSGPKNPDCWVVIDEIQKVPAILDIVHDCIEEHGQKFALTGSSARKLKRGGANLLAGRAHLNNLFPLTYLELEKDFDLSQSLLWGTLPKTVNLKNNSLKKSFLNTYVNTYLKEEILQEQLVRNVQPFKKFLHVAAQSSSTIVNLQKIADDIKVDWKTVRTYFEILEDTLIGFFLSAYDKSVRKQQLKASKFYLFDIGVKRSLDKTLGISQSGIILGPLYEQFIICELKRLDAYFRTDYSFYYLATHGGVEIDLVIERPGLTTLFVEIKLSRQVANKELDNLADITSSSSNSEGICLCREPIPRKLNEHVTVYPWQEGIAYIFADSPERNFSL